jgi:hypothetical protein
MQTLYSNKSFLLHDLVETVERMTPRGGRWSRGSRVPLESLEHMPPITRLDRLQSTCLEAAEHMPPEPVDLYTTRVVAE